MVEDKEKVYQYIYTEKKKIRLDLFLQNKIPEISRSYLQRLIKDSFVLVNGSIKKQNYRLKENDLISVKIPEIESEAELQAWDYPLDVIYEDDAIIVINKPSDLAVHPGAGNKKETIANALIYWYPEIKNVGHPLRPGIVHRLDKETQGLLIIARNNSSYHSLTKQFSERRIIKRYYAVVWGSPEAKEGIISIPIGRSKEDRKKISPHTRKPKEAITEYKVIKSNDNFSLLDIHLRTGRTHQIRVHMSYINHPIVGDKKYSGANWNRLKNKNLAEQLKRMNIFALQAYYIALQHPKDNEWKEFILPLSYKIKNLFSL